MTGFLAKDTATQSYSDGVKTELNFNDVLADPDGGFASNRFTVPASWGGKFGRLRCGLRTSGFRTASALRIEVSTDSGATWSEVGTAKAASNVVRETIETVLLAFTAGHTYRCTIQTTGSSKQNSIANWFGGNLSPPEGAAKVAISLFGLPSTTSIGSYSFSTINFSSVESDSQELFRTGGGIEVPTGFGNCWGIFWLSLRASGVSGESTAYIQGTKGVDDSVMVSGQNGAANHQLISNRLGPVPLVEGDYVIPRFYSTFSQSFAVRPDNHFGAMLWSR